MSAVGSVGPTVLLLDAAVSLPKGMRTSCVCMCMVCACVLCLTYIQWNL